MGEPAKPMLRCEDSRITIRTQLFVSVGMESEHNLWAGLALDVSEGGVFVATYRQLPVGSIVSVTLTLPDDEPPIVVTTYVRWTRERTDADDVLPGVGLQFVDLDRHSIARIRRFAMSVRVPLLFEDEN
jgi:uncharacterized protein (TIGR02266 family)